MGCCQLLWFPLLSLQRHLSRDPLAARPGQAFQTADPVSNNRYHKDGLRLHPLEKAQKADDTEPTLSQQFYPTRYQRRC